MSIHTKTPSIEELKKMMMKVLIIEDSVSLGKILKRLVTEFVDKYSTSEVSCTTVLVKSLKEWEKHRPMYVSEFGTFDFVLSDWILEDGTAYKILRDILDSGMCSTDRMAIVTGYATYDDEEAETIDMPMSFSRLYDIPIYDKPVGVSDIVYILNSSASFMDDLRIET